MAVGGPGRIRGTSLAVPAGQLYHPSPEDWRTEILYSIVVDRFQAKEPAAIEGDPASGITRHGGNLRGVTDRLGYLRELGVTAIQVSPVTLTGPGTYHGYAPRHFMAVDPRIGTMDDLRTLVAEAHAHGIRIVLDVVLNHAGPVFDYADGCNRWKGAAKAAPIRGDRIALKPVELAAPQHFSRRGVIDDWTDAEQETLGDFPPDYRRLATENPETRALLEYIACWWIRETDIDGIRLDAIRHMDRAFVAGLCRAVKGYAETLGKRRFLIIGEHASSTDALIAACFEADVDAAYNYGEYRRQNRALHGRAPARELEESFDVAAKAFGGDHGRTVRFIDNHDVYRFLRDGEPEERLRLALAFLFFSVGMPMLYYGTEQGFRQSTGRLEHECLDDPADPGNREDMFAAGRFTSTSSSGDKFDTSSPVFQWTRRLIEARGRYGVLSTGEQEIVFSDRDRPGFFAFVRHRGDDCVLVVLNTAHRPVREAIPVSPYFAHGTALRDVLDSHRAVIVERASKRGCAADVHLPAFGVAVLASPASGSGRLV